MKLAHLDHTFQIEIPEGYVQKLIVEAPKAMADFILDFRAQAEGREGRWVLSQDGDLLKIAEECELIVDLFDLDRNQKKLLKVLQEEIVREISDTELLLQWREVSAGMEVLLNSAIESVGYEIAYQEPELKALLKMVDLKFKESAEGYVESLLEYLQLVAEVRRVRLFILVNATAFLTKEELSYLYEQVMYQKYRLLLLDTRDVTVRAEQERTMILDQDYCVIEANVR